MTEDDEEKLKLGKGVAFVKSRWKRFPQGDDTWEADFEALPKPIMQRKGEKRRNEIGMNAQLVQDRLFITPPRGRWGSSSR